MRTTWCGAAGVDHMALLQGLLRHLSLIATSLPALVSADSAEAASVAVASLVNKWPKEGRKVPGSSAVWSANEVVQVVLGEVLGMEGGGEVEADEKGKVRTEGEVRAGGWEGQEGVRRLRLLAWVGWAVAARGHASMARVAHALLQTAMGERGAVEGGEGLEGGAWENGEEGEGNVGGSEEGSEAAVSAVGVAAAEGFGVVMGQGAHWLTSHCHCVCRPLYQQRFLSAFLPALASSLPHMPPSPTSQARRCAPMPARVLPCLQVCSHARRCAPMPAGVLPCPQVCSQARRCAPMPVGVLPCLHVCSHARTCAPMPARVLPCLHVHLPACCSLLS
ncbi:unnamed protein product [Closterium sp. NIES-54]